MTEQKVALVTGGSRGIGRAISLELADCGYLVIINYADNLGAAEETLEMVEKAGGTGELCQGDIAAKSHRDLVTDFVMERFGRIDMLVNNAGIGPQARKDILETDESNYHKVLETNLHGPYFLTQRVAREMVSLIEQKLIEEPIIINISSLRRYTPATNYGEYCISKAGLSMVTKLFAVRLAEHGIKVFEVSPGVIETDMTSSDAVREIYEKKFERGLAPINRWGQPGEVAKAVGAIARGCFPFSTGEVINVDGGFHLRHL